MADGGYGPCVVSSHTLHTTDMHGKCGREPPLRLSLRYIIPTVLHSTWSVNGRCG